MDHQHFDQLTRVLAAPDSRRRLLGALAALPVVGGLFGILDANDAEGKGRRKRRKKSHHHRKKTGNRAGKQKKRRCEPEPKTRTCQGKCGSVKNNCQKTVDCGSCDCPEPCRDCFLCQEQGPNTPAQCLLDPEQVGQSCGSEGQVCQADGACACGAGSCANPTPICAEGECIGCSGAHPCPAGCCDASGACQEGDATGACGLDGQMCITCEVSGEVCTGGDCVCPSHVICAAGGCCPHDDDVCDGDDQCCTPNDPCTGGACGMTADNCGQNIDCGSCPPRILRFGASPDNINRGYSETAELFWITTTATDCSIDNGVGSVPCYGSVSVGPNEATTYTLSASGPGGGPVTAQASVTVEFCHAVNPSSSGCPGSFTFCQSGPISATSSEHAKAACEACYGAGNCRGGDSHGYWYWSDGSGALTFYIYRTADEPSFWCDGYVWQPGDIIDQTECPQGRWA